jgi:hypothetical protein
MISNYCSYISRFIKPREVGRQPIPGEHHFVSTYLVPKLYGMTGEIPDYVNPDGTKAILGDVVYYRDGKHHFGIEVKLGTIRLTKKEFNEWIVGNDEGKWPNLYIGIASDGICLSRWKVFKEAYLQAVQVRRTGWLPAQILGGYGPTMLVNKLRMYLPDENKFPWSDDANEAVALERQFVDALITELAPLRNLIPDLA